jgi:hypothetical protein
VTRKIKRLAGASSRFEGLRCSFTLPEFVSQTLVDQDTAGAVPLSQP